MLYDFLDEEKNIISSTARKILSLMVDKEEIDGQIKYKNKSIHLVKEIDDENVIIGDDGRYQKIIDSLPNCFEIKKIQEREKKLDIVNIAISRGGAEKARPILVESQDIFNKEFGKLADFDILTQ